MTHSRALLYELDWAMVRPVFTHCLVAALLLSTGFVPSAVAAPIPACTANDIVIGDPGCPATGPCSITKLFEIANGCVLDFGSRNVTLASGGELRISDAGVTLRSGHFTVSPGGLVDGRTAGVGGFFHVQATGNIKVEKASAFGKILVNGDMRGGTIVLEAAGDVTIDGQLKCNGSGTASGGDIILRADGNIVTTSTADIDAHGGDQACGGSIDFDAGGGIDIGKSIDVTGGDGGSVSIQAGGLTIVRDTLQTTGYGDAGSGGCIDIVGSTVEINGQVQSKGTGSAIDSGGGCGGAIFIQSSFGSTIVRSAVDATSGGPDGSGGCIEFFVHGDVDIQSSAEIISEGTGGESCGGEVIVDARGDVLVNGAFKVSGGDSGGCVEIEAGEDITVNAPINVSGRTAGSFGGAATIEAGISATGDLLVNNLIDATGATCDAFGFCSLGGDADLLGCNVTLGSPGVINARAPGSGGSGGSVFLTARQQLTVSGTINATGGTTALDGTVAILRPTTIPPVLTGSIVPASTQTLRALCTGNPGDPPFCLLPCPTCGNGSTEFPETCDTTGPPVSCDGCSTACQLENCNDGKPCTTDTCDPVLGCRHTPVPDGSGCGDLTVCNGTEACLNGTCKPGVPLNCNDSNGCTVDSCSAVLGCQHTNVGSGLPCSDGNACTDGDTCNGAGTCVPGPPLDCDDLRECTLDSCSPTLGCQHSEAAMSFLPCTDDGDPCSIDICGFGECFHGHFPPDLTNDGAACEDGDPCTVDTCLGGLCQTGGPVTCTALDACHLPGVCSPGTGCSNPVKPDGTSCDDGNLCTQSDSCQSGICTGTNPLPCTAAGPCRAVGTCIPSTGNCTDPPAPNGMPCDDGNPCTQTDTCQGGVCTGSNPVVCTAAGPCRGVGTCNPSTGLCSDPPAPNGAPCTDGLFCTLDSCQGGVCTGTANDCDDGNACTTDTCDENADMCMPTLIMPCCGNGIVENFEECDDGTNNSDAPNSTCRTDCMTPQCGNGVVDDLLGETCDEGAGNSDAPNATCRLDCTDPRCGDGVIDDQSDEQCDDGNGTVGDGCSTQCFVEPPATATLVPGKGNKATDCLTEWKINNPTLDKRGRPATRQICTDGDPGCDADGVANGECLFNVWLCSNNTDPALPLCTPGHGPGGVGFVAVVDAKTPSARQALRTVEDAENRATLVRAAHAGSVGQSFDICGPRMQARIPLKSVFTRGRKKLKVKTNSSRGVQEVDSLPIICLPSL